MMLLLNPGFPGKLLESFNILYLILQTNSSNTIYTTKGYLLIKCSLIYKRCNIEQRLQTEYFYLLFIYLLFYYYYYLLLFIYLLFISTIPFSSPSVLVKICTYRVFIYLSTKQYTVPEYFELVFVNVMPNSCDQNFHPAPEALRESLLRGDYLHIPRKLIKIILGSPEKCRRAIKF